MGVKGYKVFNPDWTCRGFQYKVGQTYKEDVEPQLCEIGFHFCKRAVDCFNYYEFDPNNKIAEVIALGEVVSGGNKSCTNKIQIVREIPWAELLEIVNTGKGCTGYSNSGNYNSGYHNSGNYNSGSYNDGNRNSGYHNSGSRNSGEQNDGNFNSGNSNSGNWDSGNYNSGDSNSGNYNSGNWNSGDYNSGYRNSSHYNSGNYNSGNWNSGDYNSGDCNSGDFNSGYNNSGDFNSGYNNSGNHNSGNYNSGNCNSGDWNKCNFSNGCFNTTEPKIYLFNKPSKWTYKDWLNSTACEILSHIFKNPFDCIFWNDMNDEKKKEHPEAKITGVYIKEYDTSEYIMAWWRGLSDNEKNIIMSIPNFDADIFEEITGINVKEEK